MEKSVEVPVRRRLAATDDARGAPATGRVFQSNKNQRMFPEQAASAPSPRRSRDQNDAAGSHSVDVASPDIGVDVTVRTSKGQQPATGTVPVETADSQIVHAAAHPPHLERVRVVATRTRSNGG